MNIGKNIKITRVLAAVAAGTTVQNSSVLDMSGYDGVLFVGAVGALTATAVTGLKAQQGQAANLSDAADLEGSLASIPDTGSDGTAVVDVYRPRERYVRAVFVRGTANAVLDGIIAIQYKGRKAPPTHDATVIAAKYLNSPAEGTA
jgi:hypothetical protein